MSSDKESLRKNLKQIRQILSKNDWSKKSQKLVSNAIESTDWSQVSSLHCFTTVTETNEPNTKELFAYVWDNYPHIQTFTTRLIDGTWQHRQITPKGPAETPLPDFDVIFVPMLGFDSNLHRLGNGGGWYDRFLATQPKSKKVGLCFELGQIDQIPTEAHDLPLHMVVTEDKIHTPYRA